MNGIIETDVIIVGMGPTGALLGALLGELGVDTVIVERDTAPYSNPRAVQLDHEVLRLLNLVQVADEVATACQAVNGYEFVTTDHELLMGFYPSSELAPTGYPWNNLFHQPALETALRTKLADSDCVHCLQGIQLEEIEQHEDRVVAHVTQVRGQGSTRAIRSRYLVGCDGARSTVRSLLELGIDDLGFDEPWLVVDVLLPEGTEALSDKGLQLCDPARPTTSMPSGPGRHRWEFMLLPGEDEAKISSDDSVRKLLSTWINADTIQIVRCAVYHFHALFAQHWSEGRIFLAGDAAHQMPPFMGQGMCSGARDAANLAWKLAAVLRRDAPSRLLDTLQEEREPQIRQITAMAMDMGKLVCTVDEQQAAQRDASILAQPIEQRAAKVDGVDNVATGVLPGCAGGTVLPEPFVSSNGITEKLDNIAGYVPLLIVQSVDELDELSREELLTLLHTLPGTRLCTLGASEDKHGLPPTPNSQEAIQLQDGERYINALLAGEQCLLVRPDRVVFGRGELAFINQQWREYVLAC